MNTLIAAFAGAKNPKGSGSINIFMGAPEQADPEVDIGSRLHGAKSTFQILDALDSIAQKVVASEGE